MKNFFSYLFGPKVNILTNYRIHKAINSAKKMIPEADSKLEVGIYSVNNPTEKISHLSIINDAQIIGRITTMYGGGRNIVQTNIRDPAYEGIIEQATKIIATAARTEPTYHKNIGKGLNYTTLIK